MSKTSEVLPEGNAPIEIEPILNKNYKSPCQKQKRCTRLFPRPVCNKIETVALISE